MKNLLEHLSLRIFTPKDILVAERSPMTLKKIRSATRVIEGRLAQKLNPPGILIMSSHSERSLRKECQVAFGKLNLEGEIIAGYKFYISDDVPWYDEECRYNYILIDNVLLVILTNETDE